MRDPNQSTDARRERAANGENPYGYRSPRGDRKREVRARANDAIRRGTTVLAVRPQ